MILKNKQMIQLSMFILCQGCDGFLGSDVSSTQALCVDVFLARTICDDIGDDCTGFDKHTSLNRVWVNGGSTDATRVVTPVAHEAYNLHKVIDAVADAPEANCAPSQYTGSKFQRVHIFIGLQNI